MQVSHRSWPVIATLTGLEHLDVSFSDASDATVHHLTALTALTFLDLDSTDVSTAALPPLQKLSSLQTLNLADTKCGTTPASRCAGVCSACGTQPCGCVNTVETSSHRAGSKTAVRRCSRR